LAITNPPCSAIFLR